MAKHIDNLRYRRGEDKDRTLTGIMLKYNPHILYEDEVWVDYNPDGKIQATFEGKAYDVTSYYAKDVSTNEVQPQSQKQGLVVQRER